jgi:hypothetical protein
MQSVLPVEDVPELESGVDALLLAVKTLERYQYIPLSCPVKTKSGL